MRRVLLVASCLLLLLSGCTNNKEETKIQFASWGSKTEVEIIKDVIKDFEMKNPNIKVEFLHIPQNYFQKIHLLFASNTEPDVIFINNQYLPVYANANRLLPLEFDHTPFDKKAISSLSYNGVNYAIPRDISLLVIYYNKDLFRKANLAEPKFDWTFEDFLVTSVEIKKRTGAFGISFEEEPLFFLPYLMSEGGNFLDLSSKESQKGLNFYLDLRNKFHVAPRKDESASATMAQMFLQSKIAMHLSGRWLTPKYTENATFEWDTLPFPSGEKGSIMPLDASGWAITKNSKHPKEAMAFIEYLTSKEVNTKFAKTGLIIPARKDVDFTNKKAYEYELKTAQPTPVTVDYNVVLDKVKKYLNF